MSWFKNLQVYRLAAHGIMEGRRAGAVHITLRAHVPGEAVAAFHQPDTATP